jgi:hypothetical protein
MHLLVPPPPPPTATWNFLINLIKYQLLEDDTMDGKAVCGV